MVVNATKVSISLGERKIVENLSLEVGGGEFLGVVGPNGAGKSTLLRAMVGLVAHEGYLRVGQLDPRRSTRRLLAHQVAYVPQRPELPPTMRVVDYVSLGRVAHHSYLSGPSRRDHQVIGDVLGRLDATEFSSRQLGELSGGETQRVVLARALAQDAPVLIMDEPTASLDLGHGQRALELIDELRRERRLCVVCAMHDLTLAAQYADRVLVLAAGQMVAEGSASNVFTKKNIESVFGARVEILEGSSGVIVTPIRVSHDNHARSKREREMKSVCQ